MPRPSKMWVVTVDENGKELHDGEWVDIPAPDSFATGGFAHIESYITRVLQSSANFTSLIISTPDQQMAVSLGRRGGVPHFSILVEWRQQPERERAIRQFFAERSLSAFEDYLAGNGNVPDATRCLGYVLPADAQFITNLTKGVLRQIYGLGDQAGLDFTYQEHPLKP